MYLKTARILVAVSIVLSCYLDAGSGFSNSNSIKNLSDGALNPSHPVSATPDAIAHDSGSQNQAIDTYQNFYCVEDQNCADGEFCYRSRGVCLSCRKRRKRCLRDAMCCPGNHCSNGLCLPNEGEAGHHAEIEETIIESFAHEDHHFTMEPHPRRTTMPTKPHSDKDPQTVQKDYAVLVTFGPRSASQCLKKGKCAPNTKGKELMAWRYSSAVTVEMAWHAEHRRENILASHQDSTPAKALIMSSKTTEIKRGLL
ncbi:Dickkopf-related protein 1 [Acipenser ruthenus]|uniref:Dickkopf-related protein 1 n=1 Tax=Acipenser ruthenus TaxID=7906 RepID=A0A444V4C7_ACIRT|nr:Dickkopf-related protein 1 [Acipenser ruthenus]